MKHSSNDRIVVTLVVALGLCGFLWMRCVYLQLIASGRYTDLAMRQHHVTQTLPAMRGQLLDRTMRPLAVSVISPSVFANPRVITAKEKMAKRLSVLIGIDTKRIERQLKKDRGFVWVARQVDPTLRAELEKLRPVGIGIREELRRVYPHGRLASHLLGFVNIDHRGIEGIEMKFESALHGQDGWRATLRDAKGDILPGPWTAQTDSLSGYNVVLTIDAVVQEVVEETLAWGIDKYRAKGGSIIVMEPYTGAILAMANWPTFDSNAPGAVSADARRNRAVTDLFEPGSVFKIVTASALLDIGRITPDVKIDCENGVYKTVGRHELHDHRPHGILEFRDVIRLSSNIGVAKAAQRLKPDELYRYIRAFGFGQKTGIDLPGEVRGILSRPSRWSALSPYIIPMGHEIAVTPIQLAVMISAIANGGFLVSPYVVARVVSQDGTLVREMERSAPVQFLRSETAEEVQDMLVSVVESGTGQQARVQGLTVAGKTGTAQKIEPNGRYSHSRFVASFVGFGPVPDPRFVAVVNIDEPRTTYYGGSVAAPMWGRLVKRLASYLELHQLPELVKDITVKDMDS